MSQVVHDERAGDLDTVGTGHAARHASQEGELIEGTVDEVDNVRWQIILEVGPLLLLARRKSP